MTKLVIDLCAGKEGFSQAFRLDSEYEVVTLDVNKKFKPTVCADVRHLPFKKGLQPDVMLAGPPCERFSIAMPTWPKMGIQVAMQLVCLLQLRKGLKCCLHLLTTKRRRLLHE